MVEVKVYSTLVISAVNALIKDDNKYFVYKGVNESNYSSKGIHFNINGIPCVVVADSAGWGEDRITAIYDCTDIKLAKKVNNCINPGDLKNNIKLATGNGRKLYTAVKVYLERLDGPYIQKAGKEDNYDEHTFTCKKANINQLKNINPEPNGFHLFGKHKF